jgi:pilus assembly protein CpaB
MKTPFLQRARRAWAWVAARRTAWMVLGAVGFGALAVVGARNHIGERLEQEKARLQPRQELVDVVVAKRDLRRGETIGPDTMAVRPLPADWAPSAALTPARFEAAAGARLLVPMRAGEPLLPTAFASPDSSGISARVRPGIRAMTIAVDEVNSLSGMLQPGDRIDLLLSVRPVPVGGVVQPEITRTVMQDVAVLATGRQSRVAAQDEAVLPRPYTSITVEVDPEQAQKLVVAQRSGKLTAVLRNPDDRQPVTDRRLDVNMLLGLPAPVPAVAVGPAPKNAMPSVEVIVGGRGTLPSSGANAHGTGQADARTEPTALPPGEGARGAAPTASPAVEATGAAPPGATSPASPSPEGVWVPLTPPATVPLHR